MKESFLGEFTDSSDTDSAPLRNSAEAASEDYTAESRSYLDLLEKLKRSDACLEKLRPLEAAQAANRVAPVGCDSRRGALGEPSTSSLAWGRHWIASPAFGRHRGDIVEEAEGQAEAQDVGESVRVGKGPLTHNRRPWLERASRSPARKKDARAGESEVCYSPPGKRTFSELIGSERKTLPSKACSPQSEFTKWTLPGDFASRSHRAMDFGHFQRKEKDVQESTLESGVCGAAAARDRSDSLPSSSLSTSVPGSVCGNHKASQLGYVSAGTPAEVTCTDLPRVEQKSPARPVNTFLLWSEPAAHFPKSNDPENRLSALSSQSKLEASMFSSWKKRGPEPGNLFKSTVNAHPLPQSVFQKPARTGQCGDRGPGFALTLPKSDWTSLARPQAGFTRRSPGSADSTSWHSTSWHRSAVLRRGGEGSPRADTEHPQKTRLQLETAEPASQNSKLTAALGPPEDGAVPRGALLPNQVSVITKQARPERVRSGSLEHWQPPGSTPSPSVDSSEDSDPTSLVSECAGDGDPTAQGTDRIADEESPAPEVSVSWRKSSCDSPSSSVSSENFGSTDKLPFSSADNLIQSQSIGSDLQKPRSSPHTTPSGANRLEAGKPFPAEVTSRNCPARQMPCGAHHQPSTEAPAIARDSCSTPQNVSPPPTPPIVPSRALLRARVPTDPVCPSVLGSADEKTQNTSQSSLPGTSYCYTGIREQRESTEAEDESFSCSEGEHEADAVTGPRQQGDPHAPDVGDLTSALQECNLSTFLYIDKLSTSEVVMFLESCQLRDYSSKASTSECSSKGTPDEEMNKEFKQNEIFRKSHEERIHEEEILRASEVWVESEGEACCVENPSQHAQCPPQVPSDILPESGDGGKDAEHALPSSVHHSQTAEELIENTPPEDAPSSMSHPAELPGPAAMDVGGSSSQSGRPDPEHIPSRSENEANYKDCPSGGEEGLAEPAELLALSSDSPAPPRTEQSPDCVTETAFRYQISAVTSEVISVLINKNQDLVIEKGDNWTIISGVAISPGMEQVVLCDTLEAFASQGLGDLDHGSVEKSPEASPAGPLPQEPPCADGLSGAQEDVSSGGQSANFDKSRLRNRPVKPSIWIRSQIYDQTLETEKMASDHTYYNWKLEPLGKNKTRSKISNKDQSSKLAKTPGLNNRAEMHLSEGPQPESGERTNTKTTRGQAQSTMAGADVSTPTHGSPDALSRIRQEVGPPLPPLLPPLIATPPRTSRPLSPLVSSSSPSSLASPAGRISPLCEISGPPVLSPWPEELQQASPLDPSPPPSTAAASGRIVSSPLQFCAATPKHALPVPGRLPSCAPGQAAASGPPENSVKILDTMYPELSARARTLSLLKGNMQLSRGSSVDGKVLPGRVSALIGLKAITSTSTAFVLTGGSSGGDGSQGKSQDVQQDARGKRTLAASILRSAKRLRLDSESPEADPSQATTEGVPEDPPAGTSAAHIVPAEEEQTAALVCSPASVLRARPRDMAESCSIAITRALRKIAESSFDLLPVIRSHVYVGNISKKPVMRDQEKEVVYEFSTTNKVCGAFLSVWCMKHERLAGRAGAGDIEDDPSALKRVCF